MMVTGRHLLMLLVDLAFVRGLHRPSRLAFVHGQHPDSCQKLSKLMLEAGSEIN